MHILNHVAKALGTAGIGVLFGAAAIDAGGIAPAITAVLITAAFGWLFWRIAE